MEFLFDKDNDEMMISLFETNFNNLDVLTFLRNFMVNYPYIVKGDNLNEEEYIDTLLKNFNVDINNEDVKRIKKNYLLPGFKRLDKRVITDNPYYQNIKFNDVSFNDWKLAYDHYQINEPFVYRSHLVLEDNYYQETPMIGYFNEEVRYPAVHQNDNIWMSVVPNEIFTMKEAISKAKGKVLTFGLGLGYFAYMASLKEEVDEVVVIEMDEAVISLFYQQILPQFPNKEKIKVIKSEAFSYIKSHDLSLFDYIFLDLYHDSGDGLEIYLKTLDYLDGYHVDYWIEDSILLLVRKMIISILYDEYYHEDSSYSSYQSIYAGIRLLLKDKIFLDYQDIKTLLSDDSIKQLCLKLSKLLGKNS